MEVFNMAQTINKEKNYIVSTSIDSSADPEDFIVELFCPDDEENTEPKKVIHNFDELISFFENLDDEKYDNKVRNERLVKRN